MAAGPIGATWQPGSWSDTAWVANSWAQAVTPPIANTGAGRPPYQIVRPQPIRARIRWDLPAFLTRLSAVVTAPSVTASLQTWIGSPEIHGVMIVTAPSVTAWIATDWGCPEMRGTFQTCPPTDRRRRRQ